jgi:Flagellar hook-length control protein FliK
MTVPAAATHAVQSTPAFIQMIGLFLSSPNQAGPQQDTAASDTATALAAALTTPAQIADAMIKSMLGSPAPGNLPSGTAAAAQANQEAAPATTAPDKKATPSAAVPDQTPVSSKLLRDTSDIPQLAISVIAATPLVSAPVPSASAPTPPADDSRTNAALQNNPAPGPIAPLAKGSPGAKIAFTAILTPANDAAPSSAPTETSQKLVASPEPAASVPSAAPLASAAPSSNEAQSPATQPVQSETAIQAGAKAGGDTPSEQQDNSPENPTTSTAVADAKNKPAVKQDDNDPQTIVAVAIPDHVSPVTSLIDQARTVAPAQSTASAATATPSQATAEALRTSESNLAAAPPSRTGAAQEITIRIEQPDASPVDLRVVERAGQVHVDVRTPDATMQTSLRGDLGTLTNSLQRAGYQTEIFTPSATVGRAASGAQTSNRDDHQDSQQNRGSPGDSSEGRRQQQQQKRSSTWLEELEDQ